MICQTNAQSARELCVCVVLITIALSTKQLPHFSPASHRHSDLTRTSNLFTLSPFLTPSRSSYLIPSCSSLIGVCVCLCVSVILLTLYWWRNVHMIRLLSQVSLSNTHNTSVILKLPCSTKTHSHTHTHHQSYTTAQIKSQILTQTPQNSYPPTHTFTSAILHLGDEVVVGV